MKKKEKQELENKINEVFQNSIIVKELTRQMLNFTDTIRFILNLAPIDNTTKMIFINSLVDTIKATLEKEFKES